VQLRFVITEVQKYYSMQADSLLSKTKSEPLDTIRFEAGKLEGIALILRLLKEKNGNEEK
jgi:hypothetical protein